MRISKVQLQTLISEELENVVKEEQLNEDRKEVAGLAAAIAGFLSIMNMTWEQFVESPEMQRELQTLVEPMDLDQSADTDVPREEELELDIE
tara:strand:+ start:3052 stop:3327 length:276 start_codon:yes stop_codon:yes gene_type:complete